jgi:hypothetical protein
VAQKVIASPLPQDDYELHCMGIQEQPFQGLCERACLSTRAVET